MSNFTLKVSHGNELRRVTIPAASSFSAATAAIGQLFPALAAGSPALLLRWVDDDGDVITIAADEDVREAVEYSRKAGREVLKVAVVIKEEKPTGMETESPADQSQSQPQPQPHQHRPVRQSLPDFDSDGRPYHHGVTCDGCNRPLYGIRYKCAECDDFDLCEACEAKEEHPKEHVTLKIRVPTRVELWNPYGARVHHHGGNRHRHHGGHHGGWGFGQGGWGGHHHGGPRGGWGGWGADWSQQQQQPQGFPFAGGWGGRCGRFRHFDAAQAAAAAASSSSSSSSPSSPFSAPPTSAAPAAQTPSYTQPPAEPQTPQPQQSESPFFAPPRSDDEEYASHLQVLQEMGFYDHETNLRLLKERKGKIEDVISKLTQFSFN